MKNPPFFPSGPKTLRSWNQLLLDVASLTLERLDTDTVGAGSDAYTFEVGKTIEVSIRLQSIWMNSSTSSFSCRYVPISLGSLFP